MQRRLGSTPLVLAVVVAVLLILAGHPLWAQTDTTGAIPTEPKGFAIFYLLTNVVPLITAWITKQYNKGTGWFALQSNGVKMAVYVVGTMAAMLLWHAISLAFDPNAMDITKLGPEAIADFVKALVGTLLVKTGISSAKKA